MPKWYTGKYAHITCLSEHGKQLLQNTQWNTSGDIVLPAYDRQDGFEGPPKSTLTS